MNTYRITATRADGTELIDNFTERSEGDEQARERQECDAPDAEQQEQSAVLKIEEITEKLKVDLYQAAMNVNDCADQGDSNRNRVNYGRVTACENVLRALGHEVKVPCWDDGGYLRIPKVTIDGKTTLLTRFERGTRTDE